MGWTTNLKRCRMLSINSIMVLFWQTLNKHVIFWRNTTGRMSIDPYFLEFQLYNITGFMWKIMSPGNIGKWRFIGIPNENYEKSSWQVKFCQFCPTREEPETMKHWKRRSLLKKNIEKNTMFSGTPPKTNGWNPKSCKFGSNDVPFRFGVIFKDLWIFRGVTIFVLGRVTIRSSWRDVDDWLSGQPEPLRNQHSSPTPGHSSHSP